MKSDFKTLSITILTVIGLITITDLILSNFEGITSLSWGIPMVSLLFSILVGFTVLYPIPMMLLAGTGVLLTASNISNWISNFLFTIVEMPMSYDIVNFLLQLLITFIVAIATEYVIEEITIRKIFFDFLGSLVIILIDSQLPGNWWHTVSFLVLSFVIVVVDDNMHLRKIKKAKED